MVLYVISQRPDLIASPSTLSSEQRQMEGLYGHTCALWPFGSLDLLQKSPVHILLVRANDTAHLNVQGEKAVKCGLWLAGGSMNLWWSCSHVYHTSEDGTSHTFF